MIPKVTVHFTSYNHAPYLRAAIDSVLAQTFTDFELVITDDCSTDGSRDIIRSYDDPRIVMDFPDQRYSRKHGERVTKNARGAYVAIQHSDDVWFVEKLAKQVEFLDNNPEYGVVFSHVKTINRDGEHVPHELESIFTQPNRTRHEWLNHFFFKANALCHPSALMRKEGAVKHFPTYALTGLPDFYKWISFCLESEIHILQEPLVNFRVHPHGQGEGGASRPNSVRFYLEMQWVLRLFRRMAAAEDWLKVFPGEAEKYIINGEFEPGFILAHMCFKRNASLPGPCRNLGMMLLFELMDNPESRERIERLYDFSTSRLAEYETAEDIFGYYAPRALPNLAILLFNFGDGYDQGSSLAVQYRPDFLGRYELNLSLEECMASNPRKPLRSMSFLPVHAEQAKPCRHKLISVDLDGQSMSMGPRGLFENIDEFDIFKEDPLYEGAAVMPRGARVRIKGQFDYRGQEAG